MDNTGGWLGKSPAKQASTSGAARAKSPGKKKHNRSESGMRDVFKSEHVKYSLPLAVTGATVGDYITLANEGQASQGGTILQIVSGTIYPVRGCLDLLLDADFPNSDNADQNVEMKMVKLNRTYPRRVANNWEDFEEYVETQKGKINEAAVQPPSDIHVPELSDYDDVKVKYITSFIHDY